MQPSEAKLWNYDEIVMKGGKHEQKKKHLFRGFIDIKVNMTESDGCERRVADLKPCTHTSQLNLQTFKYNITWTIFIKNLCIH